MSYEINEAELRKMDLNLLVVFAALMRTRSVRQASRLLFITPSATSMALARLRGLLDDELLVRSSGGMDPTPRALALFDQLGPALAAIEGALLHQRDFDPQRAMRTIRFASPDDLEPFLLPRLLVRLKEEAPNVRLALRPSDFRSAPAALDSADADLALTATPPGLQRRHRSEVLHVERFAAVYRRGLFGRGGLRTIKQYTKFPHVLLSPAGEMSGAIDRRLQELGHERRVDLSLAHFTTFPFVLEAADRLGNMPWTAAQLYAKRFGLEARPLPFESPTFEVSLVWHARTDKDPALAWFRSVVKDAVADAVSRPRAKRP